MRKQQPGGVGATYAHISETWSGRQDTGHKGLGINLVA